MAGWRLHFRPRKDRGIPLPNHPVDRWCLHCEQLVTEYHSCPSLKAEQRTAQEIADEAGQRMERRYSGLQTIRDTIAKAEKEAAAWSRLERALDFLDKQEGRGRD